MYDPKKGKKKNTELRWDFNSCSSGPLSQTVLIILGRYVDRATLHLRYFKHIVNFMK